MELDAQKLTQTISFFVFIQNISSMFRAVFHWRWVQTRWWPTVCGSSWWYGTVILKLHMHWSKLLYTSDVFKMLHFNMV